MANFRNHLLVAAIASSAAAGWCWGRGWMNAGEWALASVAGTVGGLLPDLDADNSIPTRWLWNAAAILGASVTAYALYDRYPPATVLVSAMCVAAGLRTIVAGLVMRLTVHRGLLHSLPSGALIGLCVAHLAIHGFGVAAGLGLRLAAFVVAGFCVHLLLDELSSVDLANARVKRSFGTALKLYQTDNPIGTVLVYAALVGVGSQLWPQLSELQFGHSPGWGGMDSTEAAKSGIDASEKPAAAVPRKTWSE